MTYEVEQKFYVDDLAAVARRLRGLGASVGDPVTQSDRYLSHPARKFEETDEALRLRVVGEDAFITYKGPRIDPTTKTRRELDLRLPGGLHLVEQLSELFLLLGFRTVALVRKQRRAAVVDWQGASIEVALDEVERLGQFVELEATAEEAGLQAARQRVASLSVELGLTRNERRSYCEMVLDLGR